MGRLAKQTDGFSGADLSTSRGASISRDGMRLAVVPPKTLRVKLGARDMTTTEVAALKCVYLAVMSLDPTGRGRQRWTNRWKPALNAFTIQFPGRIITATK